MALKETWQSIKRRFGKRPSPPIIMTEWGPVTEKYRQLAAANLKFDPVMKKWIEDMIGVEESKRKYPEAYHED
ncbi:MAG: hypothetical protein WB507_07080 [Solirubrobacterales bacterium]